jgi:hypothetical protein
MEKDIHQLFSEARKETLNQPPPLPKEVKSWNSNETFTITFGDQAENHVGMQKLGFLSDEGFEIEDLQLAQKWFQEKGIQTDLHHLNINNETKDAYLLIAKGGLKSICDSDLFYQEQKQLEKDKKAWMYGRVVNKHARYNLCFGEQNQEPNYEDGKGRIVSFIDLPLLNNLRERLPEILGDKAKNMVAEGNYYYDISKCGIGFHGDSERRKVIAVRVGASLPLHFQWFFKSNPIGERIKFNLEHGDIYVMSEKATGNDWKRKSVYTLRHAAGCSKFLSI